MMFYRIWVYIIVFTCHLSLNIAGGSCVKFKWHTEFDILLTKLTSISTKDRNGCLEFCQVLDTCDFVLIIKNTTQENCLVLGLSDTGSAPEPLIMNSNYEIWQKKIYCDTNKLSCETNIDKCIDSLCQNNGTCTELVDFYTCTCIQGFTGAKCETNIDDCNPNPCLNNGTCEDLVDSFTCICVPGFTKDNCETNIDDCDPNPCLNNGTCIDEVNSSICDCETGFTGPMCEINTDDCSGHPCVNNGTCKDGISSFTCACVSGFSGKNCETNIDDCSGNPCINNGTCEDEVDTYVCNCSFGFTGPNCETNIDECIAGLCQNGGTCEDGIVGYTCTCASGFTGPSCDQSVTTTTTTTSPSHEWSPPPNWEMANEPVYYHGFEEMADITLQNGAAFTAGLVKDYAIKANKAQRQYVDFSTNIPACILKPETCSPAGGSVAFWMKIIDCGSENGILTSQKQDLTGILIQCFDPFLIRSVIFVHDGWFETTNDYPGVEWFHLVLRFYGPNTGQGITVNINNANEESQAVPSDSEFYAGTGEFIIGRATLDEDKNYSSLELDELSFWDRALTDLEVYQLYEQYS